MTLASVALTLCAFHGLFHSASIAIAARRIRSAATKTELRNPPSVTLLRPVRGMDYKFEETIGSSFSLSYPNVETIFCVESEEDPAAPALRQIIADNPQADASLLFGQSDATSNPKVNNLAKGWYASKSDWVGISDANILLPSDYVESLLAMLSDSTGLLSHAAVGTEPIGFAAELECATLNSLEARWMLAADSVGWGFAFGKSLLWHRKVLDNGGGWIMLGNEGAEELAFTKLVRRQRLKVRLAPRPVPQPLGRRTLKEVLQRQVRWARLRRAGIPHLYSLEVFLGGALPITYATAAAVSGAISAWVLAVYVVGWYGLEAALTRSAGWPLTPRMPLAWIARDVLHPLVWVAGFVGNRFEWRGRQVSAAGSSSGPADGRPGG